MKSHSIFHIKLFLSNKTQHFSQKLKFPTYRPTFLKHVTGNKQFFVWPRADKAPIRSYRHFLGIDTNTPLDQPGFVFQLADLCILQHRIYVTWPILKNTTYFIQICGPNVQLVHLILFGAFWYFIGGLTQLFRPI